VALILLGCLAVVVVLIVIGVIAAFFAKDRIVNEMVTYDLGVYREAVEGAELEPNDAQELLQTIERVRARAASGQIGFMAWVEHTPAIDDAVSDGDLDPADADLMQRQLNLILGE
jgi:hypothetical protein